MSATSQIKELLDVNTTLDRQIKIIKNLNKNMLLAETLYDVVRVFLSHAHLIRNPYTDAIDIVGTGGDGKNTLNYSTLSALVVSNSGYPIIKHGNKSATSKCGSFDFLEKICEPIPKDVTEAEDLLNKNKRVFLFAPYFHPIFQNVIKVRKHFSDLGEKTIFNILGPLLNPARPKRMLVGVYKESLIQPYSEVLSALGVEYGCVVYGDGFDEFSVCGTSTYCKINHNKLTTHSFNPMDYGYTIANESQLSGGDSEQNYQLSKKLFSGEIIGPKKDMLELNIAFALYITNGFSTPISKCIQQSKAEIDKSRNILD